MAYLSATTKARIEAQIATKTAQLEAINTAYLAALTNSEISTYKIDTGEGSEMVSRRNPAQLLVVINRLETEIDRLYRRLDGTGLCNMNLRRRG